SAVVQFIEHPQGKLCIFGAIGFRGVAQRCRVCIMECCKNTLAQSTAGFRKQHLGAPRLRRNRKLVIKVPVNRAALTTVMACGVEADRTYRKRSQKLKVVLL